MNDDKLDIKLKIAGKSYSMRIAPHKEEIYRLAEREVNRYVTKYEQAHLAGYGVGDYLAIVALQLAVSNIRLSQSREIGSEEEMRLADLAKEVETHLDK